MESYIYLDNAATTKMKPEVFAAMKPFFEEQYANPASAYGFAGKVNSFVDEARDEVADFLGAKSREIYFTGGGSESDNWALKGVAEANRKKGNHIITSKIEHHAILHTCEYLEENGWEVTYLDVDENGFVDLQQLEEAIRPETILISIMFANNEIGTIQPVKEIGRIAHEHNVLFHTDAVQAYGHVPIDVEELNIDLLSASGHKIYGPKGVGILYVRTGVKIHSFIHGGAQERGRRAGTSNVPGIVGFAKATKLAKEHMQEDGAKEEQLRDYFIAKVQEEIPFALLNGDPKRRLPNNISFCFQFIEGESLLMLLDQKKIYGSSGSACTSGSLDPSHVLLAIGRPHEIAHGSLRLTLSDETSKEELDVVAEELAQIVDRLRSMSPLYEDFMKKEKTA